MREHKNNTHHLAVDIGNSAVHFGIFTGNRLVVDFKLSSQQKNPSFYSNGIERFLSVHKINKAAVKQIIVGSVVPHATPMIAGVLRGLFKAKILIAGKHRAIPIANKYKVPRLVGVDRLLAAFAALKRYGPGLIIIDFGTAVTFDVVSKKGEYLGGLIFPGIDLSLDALFHHTALLPRVAISDPKRLVGNDTESAIRAGIVFGLAGVCDAIIERLLKKYRGYTVVATGGNIDFIKRHSKAIKKTNPFLVLQGLSLLLTN